jgi:hypothetical protein
MSDANYKPSSPVAQLGGAKRKNGHKPDCECHICENIKNKVKRGGYKIDAEKAKLKRMGGSKKKNGHKPDCGCPICKNMKNANKKGGNKDDDESSSEEEEEEFDHEKEQEEEETIIEGGMKKKKGNGHKANCGCPICKNMRKKTKKGGDGEEPDIENQKGDIEEGQLKGISVPDQEEEKPASTDEYDELDAAERGEIPYGDNKVGGTRRKKQSGKKSKGRKSRKGGKTRRHHKKRSHKRH